MKKLNTAPISGTQELLPEKQAIKVLRRTDKARKAYYRNYTDCDWNDPNLYHAVLNSDRLGPDTCADIICRMYTGG